MSHVYSYGQPKPDQEHANKLQKMLDAVDSQLKEAAEFARLHGLSFHYDGPAYGMGGSFDPESTKDQWGEDTGGWQASSQSC